MNSGGWPAGAWRWCLLLLGLGMVGGYFAGGAVAYGKTVRDQLAAEVEQWLGKGSGQ